jgi:hypothetical protein
MSRRSIPVKISPIILEGKAVASKRAKVAVVKQLNLVFFLSILFAATPACAQDSEFKLEIKRSFPTSERPEGPDQHGDFSYFKELENGGKVGSLHLFKPREAIFIIWDGEVIAGPLTTVEQVEEAYEMLSRESAAGHDLRTDIMKKYPMDRKKRYRVYDSEGKLIREDEEP